MGEWRPSTWGDEISLEYGKSLRGYESTAGQYRVFGSNAPIGWASECLVQGPGVILGRKGAYRGVHFSPDPFNAGSAVPTLNRNHVNNLPTIMPPPALIELFESVAVSLLKCQKLNDAESCTLAAQRDALLPKLLSGELRVENLCT